MQKSLVDILCCPVTRGPLRLASAAEVGAINAAIDRGTVANEAGKPVREPVSAALVATEGERVYRVDDGIPVLLAEESFRVEPAAFQAARGRHSEM